MQKLLFEEAWDRTISDKDRTRMKEAFQKAVLSDTSKIQFSMLWQAINHKEELLVTVIIHNISEEPFSFTNQTVVYKNGEKRLAMDSFSLPFTIVEGKTSMPWTFIFPKASISIDDQLKIGTLELVKSYDPD